MNKIFGMLLLTLMVGCTQAKIKTEYMTKYVPIVTVPMPPEIVKPESNVALLTEAERNHDGTYAKALVIDNENQKAYMQKLEKLYNKYKELAMRSINPLNNTTVPYAIANDPDWFTKTWDEWFAINKDMKTLDAELNEPTKSNR